MSAVKHCIICGVDITKKTGRAVLCGRRDCKNTRNAQLYHLRGPYTEMRREYERTHATVRAAQRRASRARCRELWPDERLRELGRVWALGGLDAAKAAFPGVSVQQLRNRMSGNGGLRSVKDLEAADKIARIQKIAVKNDRIDSTGLVDLILSRPRRAA